MHSQQIPCLLHPGYVQVHLFALTVSFAHFMCSLYQVRRGWARADLDVDSPIACDYTASGFPIEGGAEGRPGSQEILGLPLSRAFSLRERSHTPASGACTRELMQEERMGRRSLPTFIFSIITMLAAPWALSAQAAGAWPRAVRDDRGMALAIAKKPERIVSVTLPTDEILLALVEKRRLAAVTGFSQDGAVSNIAAQVSDVPVKLSQLNVEVIVSLKPDIVFVADWSDASSVRQLRDAGLAVYQFKSPRTVKEIQASIARIAAAVGEEGKGKALVQWMDGRLAEVASRLAGLSPGKRLSVMDYTTWSSSMGKGSSWDEIVRLAGLENAVAGLSADQYGSVPISKEMLLELDPDILILPGWVYGDTAGADSFYSLIVNDPALRRMKAVREARAHRIAERTKSSTSQYIVLAVEDLAQYAYPDLFR